MLKSVKEMNDCWRQHKMEKHSKHAYSNKRKLDEEIEYSDDLNMRAIYAKMKVWMFYILYVSQQLNVISNVLIIFKAEKFAPKNQEQGSCTQELSSNSTVKIKGKKTKKKKKDRKEKEKKKKKKKTKE